MGRSDQGSQTTGLRDDWTKGRGPLDYRTTGQPSLRDGLQCNQLTQDHWTMGLQDYGTKRP